MKCCGINALTGEGVEVEFGETIQSVRPFEVSRDVFLAPGFIDRVAAEGTVVSIGHTQANTQQIHDAVAAGATLSTHLGNGAHAVMRRHPNYIWDQLAEDRLMAGFIADGIHLDAGFLKV